MGRFKKCELSLVNWSGTPMFRVELLNGEFNDFFLSFGESLKDLQKRVEHFCFYRRIDLSEKDFDSIILDYNNN